MLHQWMEEVALMSPFVFVAIAVVLLLSLVSLGWTVRQCLQGRSEITEAKKRVAIALKTDMSRVAALDDTAMLESALSRRTNRASGEWLDNEPDLFTSRCPEIKHKALWYASTSPVIPADPTVAETQGGFGKVYRGKLQSTSASASNTPSSSSSISNGGGDRGGTEVAIREIAVSGNLIQRRKLSALLKEQCSELADLKKMVEVHVVGVLGVCDSEASTLSLVSAWMSKGSLYGLLFHPKPKGLNAKKVPKITDREKWQWLLQCAGAMEHMCTRCGCHHGNLKSANLLLDENHAVHVSDFGLCAFRQQVLDEHPSPHPSAHPASNSGASPPSPSGGGRVIEDSRSGGITPRYASPEALEGQDLSLIVSEPSDVYAFGSLIYEVLEVKVPWSNLDESQIVTRVIARGARPTFTTETSKGQSSTATNGGIGGNNSNQEAPRNEDLIALAQKCWLSDPSQRPCFSDIVVELARSDKSEAAERGDLGTSI